MAIGIKSIKQQQVVGSDVSLVIDQWLDGTTEADKNKKVTWFCFAQDKKKMLDTRVIAAKDSYIIKIPKKLAGSYKYYVEASLSGKKDPKRNTGVLVYGVANKKIVNSKWCTKSDGEDVRKTYNFSYGHIMYLGLETEGLNGDKVSVTIFRRVKGGAGTDDDQPMWTYNNVAIIDGEVNLKIGNSYQWFTKIRRPESIEEFYVRVKSVSGQYIGDGKDFIHARFLRVKNEIVSKASELPANNAPSKVGKPEVNFKRYDPCRYDKVIIHDKDSNKKPFDIVMYDPVTKKNINKYETLAKSNEAVNTIDFTFEKTTNNGCFTKPAHHKEIEIFINGKKQQTDTLKGDQYTLPIQAKANTILLKASPELFFVTPDPPTTYKVISKTCGQPNNPFVIEVYPNVERELAFILTLLRGRVVEVNVKKNKGKEGYNIGRNDSLTEYNGDKGMKLVDKELELLYQAKGGLGYGLQAKVKIDNTVSSIELGKTKNQIKELLSFYNKVQYYIKEFDGRGKEGSSVAVKVGSYPKATFELEAPNVALAIRMTNKKIENTSKIVTEYSGGLALKPITGFKIGVDILTLIQYFGLQGKIVSWLIEKTTQLADIEIYFILEFGLQARADFNLAYNAIEGLKAGTQKLEVEALLTGKAGIKSKTKEIVTIVASDGGKDSADVEKWKAEGSLTSTLLYTYEVKGDEKGIYSKHKLEFTGMKATLVVYSIATGKKQNNYFKKEFTIIEKPEEPWWKSDKEYFK